MKKFLLLSSIVVLPFYAIVAYCFIFYKTNVFAGDLAYLGAIPFDMEYEKMLAKNYLPVTYTVNYTLDIQQNKYAIFSIGDSFSQCGISGYQNYVGYILRDSVMNIEYPRNICKVQAAIALVNSGFFDETHTKFVVVECVERGFINALLQINFDSITNIKIKSEERFSAQNDINKLTMDRIMSWCKNKMNININTNQTVRTLTLNIEAFSYPGKECNLYFINEDLHFTKLRPEQIKQAKANLIKIHELFAAHGITFFYVVAADKYDVYSSFVTNNPYQENHTLDYFADLSNKKWFINTKELLLPLIQAGTKDVYKINDTHWSYIAHQKVAEEIVKRYQYHFMASR
jgi:hypothetical protein